MNQLMTVKNSLKANVATVERLRKAATKVAPNRGPQPSEAPRDSAGTLLRRAKTASAEAAKLLRP
jgi:hypothetical protein